MMAELSGMIFIEGELVENSVCANFAHTAESYRTRITCLIFTEKSNALQAKKMSDKYLFQICVKIQESVFLRKYKHGNKTGCIQE